MIPPLWLPLVGPSVDGLALAIELSLKATLVVAAAALADHALRRSSAAARHGVWCCALLGLALLPAAVLTVPRWSAVPLPDALREARIDAPAVRAEVAAWTAPAAAGTLPDAVPALSPRPADARPAPARPALPAGAWVGLAWLAGLAAAAARALAGRLAVARLARGATPIVDPDRLRVAAEAAAALGLRREVRLLEGPRACVPMTWGVLAPRVMLPAAARSWDRDRVRAVLLHELAHVRRRDCLTQAVAGFACALFWFHPAAWYAARRLRAERERACDDLALSAHARATDYAGHLLAVARSLRPAPGAALAFARTSQLEERLVALLDPRRRRSTLGAAGVWRLALPSATLLGALAALEPAADPATAGPRPRTALAPRPATPAPWPARERLAVRPREQARRSTPTPRAAAPAATVASARALETPRPDHDEAFAWELETVAPDAPLPTRPPVVASVASAPVFPETPRPPVVPRPPIDLADLHDETHVIAPHAPDPEACVEKEKDREKERKAGKRRSETRQSRIDRAIAGAQRYGLGLDASTMTLLRFEDAGRDAQLQAIDALGQLGEGIGLPHLKRLVESDADVEVRGRAARALGSIGGEGAFGTLVGLIWRRGELEVRRRAVEALGRFPAADAVPALLDIARGHPIHLLRQQAARTLDVFPAGDLETLGGDRLRR